MYRHIGNPSDTHTMVATMRRAEWQDEQTYYVSPGQELAVLGRVQWPIWSLRWVPVQGFEVPDWDLL